MGAGQDHGLVGYVAQDEEEIYRWAASRLVRTLVQRFPRIEITLDKRYTNARLRNLLEVAIRDGLSDLPHQLVLIHLGVKTKIPREGNSDERLTPSFDFNLSRSISGTARSVLRTAKVIRLYDTVQKYFSMK